MSNNPSKLSEPEHRKAQPAPFTKDEVWLGLAVLTAPVAWALHLTLTYGMTYPAERWQNKAVLHVISLGGALAALTSLLLGWRALRSARHGRDDAERRERSGFLSLCACGVGIFFLIAILAQEIPATMLPLGVR